VKSKSVPRERSFVGQLRKEMTDMKSLMRMTGLGLIAFADGIEDELREAIEKGCRITYEIKGTLPEGEKHEG
jgi:hypothetical protein